jgi:hypothetical protein
MRNLEEFGIDVGLLISGLFGAILMLSKNATDSIKTTVLSIVGGAASANYLTPVIMDVTGIKMPKAQFSIAFLMGYLGLKGVELISNKVIEHSTPVGKTKRKTKS